MSQPAALSELSHRLNNPTVAILGLVEFLLRDAPAGSPTEKRLQLVKESGLEIREIVRSLRDDRTPA